MVQSDGFFHGGFTALCRVLRHKTVCQWKLLNWFGVLHDCDTALVQYLHTAKEKCTCLSLKGAFIVPSLATFAILYLERFKNGIWPLNCAKSIMSRGVHRVLLSCFHPCAVWVVTQPTWNKISSSQQFPQLRNALCLIITVAHKEDIRFGKVTRFGFEDADKWPFRCLFVGIYTE